MINPKQTLFVCFIIIIVALCMSSFMYLNIQSKINTCTTLDSKGYGVTETYTYDYRGRILTSINDANKKKTIYDYSHSDTVISFTYVNGEYFDTIIWPLDMHGHAIRSGYSFDTYDENGFVIKEIYKIGAAMIYEVSGNDLLSKKMITATDTLMEIYSYYPTQDFRDYGQPYLGRTSFHLRKTQTNISYNKHTRAEFLYKYTFDKQGRVLKETHLGKNGIIGTKTFTYPE